MSNAQMQNDHTPELFYEHSRHHHVSLEGYKIVAYKGVVRGIIVRAPTIRRASWAG